jgi:asparagine synthase (glutamine-hydrolysing)
MCGIAGIIETNTGPADALHAKLTAMNAAMKHRGPDDEGVWISPSGTSGLAQCVFPSSIYPLPGTSP